MEVSILSTIFATTSALFGLGKGVGDTLIIFYQSMIEVMAIQVVPGRAGGGSFKRKKNYIAKKEFAYRMCAR